MERLSVSSKPKKAYHVDNSLGTDDYRSSIVFAKSIKKAKELGVWELDCEIEEVDAKRDNRYDQYAEQGYIPNEVLYEEGWHLGGCFWCNREIGPYSKEKYEDDLWEWEHSYDENEEPPLPFEPVFEEKNKIFCCPQCRDNWNKERENSKKLQDKARKEVQRRYPGCEIVNSYGGFRDIDVIVEFKFPGGQYSVEYRSIDPEVAYVCNGDLPAWSIYKEKLSKNKVR